MRYEWGQGGVLLRDGEQVGSIRRTLLGEKAAVELDGRRVSFGRDGRDRVALDEHGGLLARATPPPLFTVFALAWEVTGEGGAYRVAAGGLFTSRLDVTRDSALVGQVVTARFLGNRPALELTAEVPPVDAVFLLWVGHLVRTRRSASFASGGGGGDGAAG